MKKSNLKLNRYLLATQISLKVLIFGRIKRHFMPLSYILQARIKPVIEILIEKKKDSVIVTYGQSGCCLPELHNVHI